MGQQQGLTPLRTALFADEAAIFRIFLTEDDCARLHQCLAHQGQRLFLEALAGRGHEQLMDLIQKDRAAALVDFLRARNGWALRELLLKYGLLDLVLGDGPAAPILALEQKWRELAHLFPAHDPALLARLAQARKEIRSCEHVRGRFLDTVTVDGRVQFDVGALEFTDRHSAWSLIHEIFANEDYYFETATDTPRILDCGTHIGASIFFFKRLFPKARITGFEPVPALRQRALENFARNQYTDVEVLPYALAPTATTTVFHLSETYSMAGSLVERRSEAGDEVTSFEVETRPLSEFLQEPVDFLKVDIEGVECEVLEEAEPYLTNVQYLFCEFHVGLGLGCERLQRILAVLDRQGFEYQVAKSRSFRQTSQKRPLLYLGGIASLVIWAKKKTRLAQ